MERGQPAVAREICGHAGVGEGIDDFEVPLGGGELSGISALEVAGPGIGAAGQQEGDRFGMAHQGGQEQGRAALVGFQVRVGAEFEQSRGRLALARLGGGVERGQPGVTREVGGHAGVGEGIDDFEMPLGGGELPGISAVEVAGPGIGASGEQQAGHLGVCGLGREEQGGCAVGRHRAGRGARFEKGFHALGVLR